MCVGGRRGKGGKKRSGDGVCEEGGGWGGGVLDLRPRGLPSEEADDAYPLSHLKRGLYPRATNAEATSHLFSLLSSKAHQAIYVPDQTRGWPVAWFGRSGLRGQLSPLCRQRRAARVG